MKKQPERITKTVPITAMDPNKIFTRSQSGGESLAELVRSLEETGEPIHRPVVRPRGKRYEIICRHRRVDAVKAVGETAIEVDVISDLDDQQVGLWLLTENMIREDLSAVDAAELYMRVAQLLNDAETPRGSTPHFLSKNRAAALIARHVGKAEDTIRKILFAVPSDPELRERLRKVDAKTEHLRAAKSILGKTEIDSAEKEKLWVDLVSRPI